MEKQSLFVRKATGLVRDIGLFDAFVINFGWTGAAFSLSMAFMISQALWAYPQSNFAWAQIITLILVVIGSTIPYALLSIAMPRVGGDYVFISRIIHPLVGFVASFVIMVMLSFFVAWGAFWGGAQALASTLANLGYVLNVPSLVAASEWFAGTTGAFIFATILIIIFGLVIMAGVRTFVRLNQILLIVGLIGMVIGVIIMAGTTSDQFRLAFNQFVSIFSQNPNYYEHVVNTALEGGYASRGFSFAHTIAILPIVAFSSLFAVGSTYVGGEVRNVGRTQLLGMTLGLAVLAVLNALIYWLLVKSVGQGFLGAANYLWYEGTLPDLPLMPFFNLFILVMTRSPILLVLVGLGYFAMSVLFVPMNIFLNTRMVFAWTFDRIFPPALANVSKRTHSPVNATIFVLVIAEIFLVIFAFTPWLATLSAIGGILLTMICTSLAAALFPFRRKAAYEASAIARYKIAGLPAVAVCGVIGVLYLSSIEIAYLVNPKYLVNALPSLLIIGGVIVLGIIIYLVAAAVQRGRGVSLARIQQEIPPE